MDDAALVVWLLSAAAGLTLGTIWLLRGGLRQRDEVLELSYAQVSEATNLGDRTPPARRSRLPVWVVSTHAALALLGLFLWIYYIDHQDEEGTGVGAVPPLIVTLLAVVATLGILMFRRWRAG